LNNRIEQQQNNNSLSYILQDSCQSGFDVTSRIKIPSKHSEQEATPLTFKPKEHDG